MNIIKKFSTILAMTVVTTVLFSIKACTKELPTEGLGVITMTTMASEVSFFVAGARDIAIDWGDGRRSSVNDASLDENSGNFRFSQDFSGETARNIVITGNVTRLDCARSQLTALDVSRSSELTELDCSGNQLTALDVSRNTALTHLYCGGNQLTALDVSRNTELKIIRCSRNRLTTIDLGNNTALEGLNVDRNQLTALDVSRNTALIGLNINYNQIVSLDFSKNTALFSLSLVGNQFTADALNDLFRSLPETSGGIIFLGYRNGAGNPGNQYCDDSIARSKGWDFRSSY